MLKGYTFQKWPIYIPLAEATRRYRIPLQLPLVDNSLHISTHLVPALCRLVHA